jgi:hypothetical protein
MGLETVMMISTVMQVAGSVAGYFQQKDADKEARNAANAQANLLQSDANRAAQEELVTADKARKTQLMDYLSSGVSLEGSPLLVMQETRNKGIENMKNTLDTARQKGNLLRQQGSVGRASLLGTLGTAAGQVATGYTQYSQINKSQNNQLH